MKEIINNKVVYLQSQLKTTEIEELNSEIEVLNKELNNLIVYRSQLLKEDKKLNDEIEFLFACQEKLEELEKEI